jgi:P27 family predicted phage terminase small subunit
MARPRQPLALIQAKGKKHLTKEEIAKREAEELNVPPASKISPPEYLLNSPKLAAEFTDLAEKLIALKILTELDADSLARYVMVQQNYLHYTALLNKAMRSNKVADMATLQTLQDKAFKQVRAAASDLGLTISSRCKLVVPQAPAIPKENKFKRFDSNG